MLMPETSERRVNGPDEQVVTTALKLQHLHVAKSLREHRIPRIEIGELHHQPSGAPETKGGTKAKTNSVPKRFVLWSRPGRFNGSGCRIHETSLPGSISKSRARHSEVLGLITSSTNLM